ncbi:chemotaxis response regulator protein-glutamate methylesterase [Alicyclobacillus contaminans]|uniref:chemotaxis-specific protein-glutamate methyltransferase CheB n=1 Tax=Alicyclobacillus contaminans TaxID=392016 RepID=UPI000404A632|nr:chemotaxis-specific protein-glutamate methyltransferase CheB [Alicyclobacillus contaminans]GMA51234.1 chemotaxis response regulator protein-glutamate methylesterase [Alicyclobacillus contaminans]
MEQPVNVLVVDDSAFMRLTITHLIERCPNLKVVGTARDGVDAVEKAKRLNPDVITMDVDMPKLDGIAAVRALLAQRWRPIVMLSARTEAGTAVTLEALTAGAVECFLKTELLRQDAPEELVSHFHQTLLSVARRDQPSHPRGRTLQAGPIGMEPTGGGQAETGGPIRLVVIGCSTGGPPALSAVLPQLPADFSAPILVLQHMPAGFTKPLAERLGKQCRLPVHHVEGGERLRDGHIYIAQAGQQTYVEADTDSLRLAVRAEASVETRYRPSVDVTLLSLPPTIRPHVLAVIMTGMGNDGLRGCQQLKAVGGRVMAEAPETCAVYGMPRAVVEAGLADAQLPLPRIADGILNFVSAGR